MPPPQYLPRGLSAVDEGVDADSVAGDSNSK